MQAAFSLVQIADNCPKHKGMPEELTLIQVKQSCKSLLVFPVFTTVLNHRQHYIRRAHAFTSQTYAPHGNTICVHLQVQAGQRTFIFDVLVRDGDVATSSFRQSVLQSLREVLQSEQILKVAECGVGGIYLDHISQSQPTGMILTTTTAIHLGSARLSA